MQKLSTDVTYRLENQTTKKLMEYINSVDDIDKISESIYEEYPSIEGISNRLSFNIYLTTDYLNLDGRTFIERYLDEHGSDLPLLEENVLIERNKSFLSLFEIIGYEDDYMLLRDALQNLEFKVWEPQLNSVLHIGEFILVRIGKIVQDYNFIGEISYLPESSRSMFMEEFIIDYNIRRINEPELTTLGYIKKYSLYINEIYNNCIQNTIELDDSIDSFLYDEIDEFEDYLSSKRDLSGSNKDITNLIEFFEYYLAQEDLTLYDLDKFDFKYFFKFAIDDGFITSKEELNSYISTFVKYMKFLRNKDVSYKDGYLELLSISENRFSYMSKLKNFTSPFKIDRCLENKISDNLNDTSVELLINFDRFLLYIIEKEPQLTVNNKLKRIYLKDLNEFIEDRVSTKGEYANQSDYPIIDMFFNIGLKVELINISKNKLLLTKKGTNFIRLRDEEKFSLIFTSIWNKEFFKSALDMEDKVLDLYIDRFLSCTINLLENKQYDVKFIINEILDENKHTIRFLQNINEYLKLLGLARTNFYPTYTWEITRLGKIIFKYLYDKKYNVKDNSIVELDKYRDKKHQ